MKWVNDKSNFLNFLNLRFSDIFRGYRNVTLGEYGLQGLTRTGAKNTDCSLEGKSWKIFDVRKTHSPFYKGGRKERTEVKSRIFDPRMGWETFCENERKQGWKN